MLGLTIDRSIEARTTKPVRRGGRPGLSHLPEYEGDLRDCPVDPPTDPARSKTVEFVLRGSVRTVPCMCVGGRILYDELVCDAAEPAGFTVVRARWAVASPALKDAQECAGRT